MDERTRKLTDGLGCHLWTRLYRAPEGILLEITEQVPKATNRITMDMQGAAVLAGFIAAIRLAAPKPLPPERTSGRFSSSFRYVTAPVPAVRIEQEAGGRLDVRSSFWDIVAAELALVCALGRDLPGDAIPFTCDQSSLTAH